MHLNLSLQSSDLLKYTNKNKQSKLVKVVNTSNAWHMCRHQNSFMHTNIIPIRQNALPFIHPIISELFASMRQLLMFNNLIVTIIRHLQVGGKCEIRMIIFCLYLALMLIFSLQNRQTYLYPSYKTCEMNICLEEKSTYEPLHVISNNVAFHKCRLRRASAASF